MKLHSKLLGALVATVVAVAAASPAAAGLSNFLSEMQAKHCAKEAVAVAVSAGQATYSCVSRKPVPCVVNVVRTVIRGREFYQCRVKSQTGQRVQYTFLIRP